VAITTVGWHLFSRFLDMPDRDIDYMINAELRSVIRLARAILPIMADQKGGRACSSLDQIPERWAIAMLRCRRPAGAA
jgi:short-subunit dehydrogenase